MAGEDFSHLQGKMIVGVVKTFNPKMGRGFIEAEEALGKDIYVHGSVLEEVGAGVGDTVEFKVHLNKQGLPQASAPLTVLESASGLGKSYRGVVKSFSEKSGYGFVECDETFREYKRDVYMPGHIAQATGCRVDEEVVFYIAINNDGMPVVKEMSRSARQSGSGKKGGGKAGGPLLLFGGGKGGKDTKDGGKFGGKASKAYEPQRQAAPGQLPSRGGGKGKAMEAPVEEEDDGTEAFLGRVKSFNAKNGYGFVECEATDELYGHDIQIPKGVSNGLKAGDEVGFKIDFNSEGMPVCCKIWQANDGPGPKARPKAAGTKRKLEPQDEKSKKVSRLEEVEEEALAEEGFDEEFPEEEFVEEPLEEDFAAEEPIEEEEFVEEPIDEEAIDEGGEAPESGKETYEGEVVRYDMVMGRGFISCEGITAAFGNDVYVHRSTLAEAGAGLGDIVKFKVHVNKKGEPQASAPLTIVSKGEPKLDFIGKVKSYSELKGYGFVDCPEIKDKYDRDAYLPGSKGKGCYVGQEVCFMVDLNNDGMPVVNEIYPLKIEDAKGGGKGGKDAGKGKMPAGKGKMPGAQKAWGPAPVGAFAKGPVRAGGGGGALGPRGGGALGPGGASWGGKPSFGGGGALGPGGGGCHGPAAYGGGGCKGPAAYGGGGCKGAWSGGGALGPRDNFGGKGFDGGKGMFGPMGFDMMMGFGGGFGKGPFGGKGNDYGGGGFKGAKGAKTARFPY